MTRPPKSPIRVLVVDDSAFMRLLLTDILNSDPDIQVIDSAEDVPMARRKIKELDPDVLTLDVEMPGMDGLSFLEKIMTLRPMPVVMISEHTRSGSDLAFSAFELGAFDVIDKTSINLNNMPEFKSAEIISKVKAASMANVAVSRPQVPRPSPRPSPSPSPRPPGPDSGSDQACTLAVGKVAFIGASAGGVEAMRNLVSHLPELCPPILYAQHMPAEFIPHFTQRLDECSSLTVKLAEDGERLRDGTLYVGPGGYDLEIAPRQGDYVCHLRDADPAAKHKPSVDKLFHSAARVVGSDAIGVILTGMGRDGAAGLLAMRVAGARTIGQDEATALIYGMPRAAEELGAVEKQLPLRLIPKAILEAAKMGSTRTS
ncbi:MAG: protein-glutamate methylesterase/protein-glutamine glutaminase [Magnetovibrionaceae bacterium]